jgi:hypothetical protein
MPPLQHARLGASNAHRWMNCLGSVRLSAGLAEIEEEYQIEGRAAHTLAEQLLMGGPLPENVRVETQAGERLYPVDDEMREGVALFVKTVQDAAQALGFPLMLVEQRVSLKPLDPPEPMFGTADVILLGRRILRVFDLKYGRGVIVEVRDNEQLLYYVLGAVLNSAMTKLLDPADPFQVEEGDDFLIAALSLFDEVTVTIVQPRAPHIDGPVRTWEVGADEIRVFGQRIMAKAQAAQNPEAPLVPGAWCRFCPAQGSCPALKQHAQIVAQVDFAAVPLDTPPSPEHLSVAVVADMLTQVPILEAWIAAMYRRVTQELEAGREVPGWKLVNKRAMRKWADENEVKRWAIDSGYSMMFGLHYETMKSPAQVEKDIGKNIPDALIKKESSGTNLVPESDPRPAAAVGPAEEFLMLSPPSPA